MKMSHTWPEECKSLVEVAFIDVNEDVGRLRSDLLVSAEDDDQEPAANHQQSFSRHAPHSTTAAYLVYEIATRLLCHAAASSS